MKQQIYAQPSKSAALDLSQRNWRADVGVVRQDEDLQTYERLIAEAGPANVEVGSGSLGSRIVLRRLERQRQYANQKCQTQLLT